MSFVQLVGEFFLQPVADQATHLFFSVSCIKLKVHITIMHYIYQEEDKFSFHFSVSNVSMSVTNLWQADILLKIKPPPQWEVKSLDEQGS